MGHRKHEEIDLLHGRIWDKLLLIALPLAATGILQQLFNAADVAVVGRFVGERAMAAVGSNSSVINLLVNLFLGVSLGTNVVIAQSIGIGDRETIHQAVHTSVIVAFAGGVAVALLGELAAGGVIRLLSVPEDVYPLALLYLRIYLLGLPVIFLYNFEAAIFRSRGDTKTPLLVLSVSGVINVALNLFFVIVLGLSVAGVAIATVASNLISALLLFRLLCKSRTEVRIDPRAFCFDGRVLRRILRIGVPAGIQSMVFSLSNICIQSAINSLGTIAMAGSAAAFNLEIFSYHVLSSFGQGCTTFVGQNYGAGQYSRCRRVVRVSLLLDAVMTAVSCGLILTFSSPLLRLFNTNPEVVAIGTIRLRWVFPAYAFSLIIENLSGCMRGFGASLPPALATLLCICGLRIVWVYLVFPHMATFAGLMAVYPITLGLAALTIAVLYRFRCARLYAPVNR